MLGLPGGKGVSRVYWGLARSVGTQGPEEYRWHKEALGAPRGIGDIGGGKWTGSPATMGPSPGSQHSHWFPLGSDLPDQGQASDRNEHCRLLYTFGTIFSDSLHICIYAT